MRSDHELVATSPDLAAKDRRLLARDCRHLPADGGAAGVPTGRAALGRGGTGAVAVGLCGLLGVVACAVGTVDTWWLPLAFGGVFGGAVSEVYARLSRGRTIDRCRGRFLVAGDLDAESLELLDRADAAVEGVLASQVVRDGVLDADAVRVLLRDQRWGLARDLARQTRLRRRLHDAAGDGGDRTAAVASEQLTAVGRAAGALSSEVADLERYAEQVRDVDEVHRDWRQARDLRDECGEECTELLAGTARSASRAADLVRVAGDARTLARSFDTG